MRSLSPSLIKSLTPIIFVGTGLVIAIATLLISPNNSASGFGLAATAIAGGSGLANSSEKEVN